MAFEPANPGAPNIYPTLIYVDGRAAIDFLQAAFAFEPLTVFEDDDGRIAHAELRLGAGIIMLGGRKIDAPIALQTNYVAISNVDEHYARAKAAGAEIITELHDTDYGSRDYAAKDIEGHSWFFGIYQPVTSESN